MYRARNTRNMHNCLVLFEFRDNVEFIVFDTETTGTKDTDQIVELSAIKCRIRDRQPEVIGEFQEFIRPEKPMDEKVIAIHGITNEFLADKPAERAVFPAVQEFFGPNPILVGHNVDFDVNMMAQYYNRMGESFRFQAALDTLEMCRDLIFGKGVESYRLSDLTEMLGLNAGLEAHSAKDDTMATYRLLVYCYHEYKRQPVSGIRKRPLYVNYMYYWKGYNKNQAGMWLNTDAGKIYYSTCQKAWMSSQVNLAEYDIDLLEQEVLRRTGLPSIKEFGKLTQAKYQSIQQANRQRARA